MNVFIFSIRVALICSICFFSWGLLVCAQEGAIGVARNVSGEVKVVRGGKDLALKPGMDIQVKDLLRTGRDGSAGIILKDDSIISLGPSTELVVEEFLFSPGEGKLSWINRMTKGTAVFLTGIIGRLSPQSVQLKTPVATVGIRGTRFAVKIDE